MFFGALLDFVDVPACVLDSISTFLPTLIGGRASVRNAGLGAARAMSCRSACCVARCSTCCVARCSTCCVARCSACCVARCSTRCVGCCSTCCVARCSTAVPVAALVAAAVAARVFLDVATCVKGALVASVAVVAPLVTEVDSAGVSIDQSVDVPVDSSRRDFELTGDLERIIGILTYPQSGYSKDH